MQKKILIGALGLSLACLLLQGRRNSDAASSETNRYSEPRGEHFDAEKTLALELPNVDDKNAQLQRDQVQTIFDHAALELSKIACAQKDELIARALDNKEPASVRKLLHDISSNQCLSLRHQQIASLLNIAVDEDNLVALIDAYKAQVINHPGVMKYLDLFRASIAEWEQEQSEGLRREIVSALQTYVQNSSSVLDIAVALRTCSDFAEKNLLSTDALSVIAALDKEFEDEKRQFYRDAAAISAKYQHLDVNVQSPAAKIASQLGVAGVTAFVDGTLRKEFQIAQTWKGKLIALLQ